MPRLVDLTLADPFGDGSGLWGHWVPDNARRGGLILLGPSPAAQAFAEAGYEVWQLPAPVEPVESSRACRVLEALLQDIEGPRFLVGYNAAAPCAWTLALSGAGLTSSAAYGAFELLTEVPALPFILHLDDSLAQEVVESLRERLPDLKIHRLSAGADLAHLRTLAVFSRASGRGEGA